MARRRKIKRRRKRLPVGAICLSLIGFSLILASTAVLVGTAHLFTAFCAYEELKRGFDQLYTKKVNRNLDFLEAAKPFNVIWKVPQIQKIAPLAPPTDLSPETAQNLIQQFLRRQFSRMQLYAEARLIALQDEQDNSRAQTLLRRVNELVGQYLAEDRTGDQAQAVIKRLAEEKRRLESEHSLVTKEMQSFFGRRLASNDLFARYKKGILAGLPPMRGIPDGLKNVGALVDVLTAEGTNPLSGNKESVERKILSLHLVYQETAESLDLLSTLRNKKQGEVNLQEQKKERLLRALHNTIEQHALPSLRPEVPEVISALFDGATTVVGSALHGAGMVS